MLYKKLFQKNYGSYMHTALPWQQPTALTKILHYKLYLFEIRSRHAKLQAYLFLILLVVIARHKYVMPDLDEQTLSIIQKAGVGQG